MTKSKFEARLKKVYNGTVQPLGRYLNEHATMQFHCAKCGADFYNKAGYMIGRDSQRHICTMPYGDRFGNRLSSVSSIRKAKGNKKPNTALIRKLDQLIAQDYPTRTISAMVGVNVGVISSYVEEKRAATPKS